MDKPYINMIKSFNMNYKPRDFIGLHKHTFFHYIYVYEGEGEIVLDSIKMKLTKGSIYLVQPVMNHEFTALDSGMSTIEIKFDVGESELFARMCTLPLCLNVKDTDIYSVLSKMVYEAEHGDKYSNMMMEIKFHEMMTTLFRSNDKLNISRKGESKNNRFSEIFAYINKNLQNQITLKDLADIVHMDSVYFLKQFKIITGTTPMSYVRNARIERAKKLLDNSDMNITQISSSVGFSSVHHFSNTFKKTVGCSPVRYKEREI